MPQFNAAIPSAALYPGNQVALVNSAATDGSVTKTISVAVNAMPGYDPVLTVVNTTNQTATAQVGFANVEADYQPLSNGGTAVTVATNTVETFTCSGPWVRFTFSSAPTSGSLVLCR